MRTLAVLSLLIGGTTASAATLTVGPNGQYTSIADALGDANDGDIIEVAPGTYRDDLFIENDVQIIGTQGASSTQLQLPEEGVIIDGATVTLSGLRLTNQNNRALRAYGADTTLLEVEVVASLAGAYFEGGQFSISDSLFEDNGREDITGAGVRSNGANGSVSTTRFVANLGTTGAALYAEEGDLAVASSEFTENSAGGGGWGGGGEGGAISADFASLEITGSTFEANTSETGGALYLGTDASALLTDSTIEANESGYGAGVYLGPGTLEIRSTVFAGNTSDNSGGAIRWRNEGGGGELIISSSTFVDNSTNSYGGALGLFGGRLLLVEDTDFEGNSAVFGGAVSMTDINGPSFIRNHFCANVASDEGGGIRMSRGGGDSNSYTNNIFQDNESAAGGGMFFEESGNMRVLNNTFVGNGAQAGGGLLAIGQGGRFANNLVAWTRGGDGITGQNTNLNIAYNAWFENNQDDATGSLNNGNNAVEADPQLVLVTDNGNCSDDQLWPDNGSPLIDAGDPNLQDPDGSDSDIGAYGGPDADPSVFVDNDGDGFTAQSDCDDANADVFPGAEELCDGLDNDCNGDIDDGTTDSTTFYADADGDGVGSDEDTLDACAEPEGYVSAGGDCDDANAEIYPGAAERCDEIDNDCDGEIDEDIQDVWYEDADGDGWGTDVTLEDCDPDDGWAPEPGDCDDSNPDINPAADDVDGDGVDSNCDGSDGSVDDGDGDEVIALEGAGCGCSSAGGLASFMPLLVLLPALLRRRRD